MINNKISTSVLISFIKYIFLESFFIVCHLVTMSINLQTILFFHRTNMNKVFYDKCHDAYLVLQTKIK